MIGKLVFIALVCVSLTQAQGNVVEEAIKNGIRSVTTLYEASQAKIKGSIESITRNKDIETKTAEYFAKADETYQKTQQTMRRIAEETEEKAKELKKPESVFKCIKDGEKRANERSQTQTNKIKEKFKNLQSISLEKFQRETKPLNNMLTDLERQYSMTVSNMRGCGTTSCVLNLIKQFGNWAKRANSDIEKIYRNVKNIIVDHGSELSNQYFKYLEEVNQINSDGANDIKKCLDNAISS